MPDGFIIQIQILGKLICIIRSGMQFLNNPRPVNSSSGPGYQPPQQIFHKYHKKLGGFNSINKI